MGGGENCTVFTVPGEAVIAILVLMSIADVLDVETVMGVLLVMNGVSILFLRMEGVMLLPLLFLFLLLVVAVIVVFVVVSMMKETKKQLTSIPCY